MIHVGTLADILRPTEIHDSSDLVQKPVRRVGLSFGIMIAILLLAGHLLKALRRNRSPVLTEHCYLEMSQY
jgi:hypothetical protein